MNAPEIDDWNQLLAGKVAVVTGGAGGIGAAVAELFAAHGAHVEIADRDLSAALTRVDVIGAAGGVATAHGVDVTQPAEVSDFAADVVGRHGRLDVLVNNVGDYRPHVSFHRSGPDHWDWMYEINLRHVFAVTKSFFDALRVEGGSVVNVHSVEGMRSYPADPVYAAMKAAVAHFTSSLAVLAGRWGVRVNGIGTDLTQSGQADYVAGYEEHQHLWPSWAPVGRLGWPADQARVALFLASDMSAYVTGQNIAVDGGTLAGGGWYYSPVERMFTARPKHI